MVTERHGSEAKDEAYSGDGKLSAPTPMSLRLGPLEVAALREAVEVYLFFDVAGGHHGILQDLYALFSSWQRGDVG